jgi:hypothetical protein
MNSFLTNFFKGMGSLNLSPPLDEAPKPTAESAWEAVGRAFAKTGASMWQAVAQFEARQENQASE